MQTITIFYKKIHILYIDYETKHLAPMHFLHQEFSEKFETTYLQLKRMGFETDVIVQSIHSTHTLDITELLETMSSSGSYF